MPFRLVGHAEDRIDAILLDGARRWGISAAGRYHRLILAAAAAAAASPSLIGSRAVPGLPGVRSLHLVFARRFVPADDRVAEPRHLVVYRSAPDGAVEILSVIHDRMLLDRAARQAVKAARDHPS